MTEKPDQPFSPAMTSALRAVARLKGESAIAWTAFQAEGEDDRYAPVAERDPRQGSKPAGR